MKKILMFSNILKISTRRFEEYHIEIASLYNEKIPNGLIRILNKSIIAQSDLIYGIWTERMRDFDQIIIFDSDITPQTLMFFYKMGVANKVLLYYLNKIADREKKLYATANRTHIKQATYNIHDSQEYKIKYVPQFWNRNMAAETKPQPIKWDITFCGAAKDRLSEIVMVENVAKNSGCKTNFWIVSSGGEPGTQRKRISYQTYLQDIQCSNAILDIVGNDNWGLTWRPLEALFFRKKLITNYVDIKKYDFYQEYKDNILVISNDNVKDIVPFLKEKYVLCSPKLDQYDIEGWLEKIVNL